MTRDDLLAVRRPFGTARPLPVAASVDPGVLALERRVVFGPAWVPVAHEADLPRPGDWVRAPLPDANVVVVCTADLGLAALHGVCPHRGTLLCDGDAGQLPTLELRCPYHGWTFATDGRLLAAPGAVDAPEGLARVRLETFGGVVFVNVGGEAPPLADALPPWLRRVPPHALRRVRRTDHEVRANWKVVVGNFQESHHFPTVHPALEGRTPWAASTSVTGSDAWLGGTMELAAGFETVSLSGRRRGRAFVAAPEDRSRVHDALVFPLWMTSLQPDYLLTYRLAPLAADLTRVVAEIHVHPAAAAADLDDVFGFWDRTNAEDRAICELQQRGLALHQPRPLRYATSEDGLHAFECLVARRYLEAS